jgi:hypothetical protein
MNIYLGKTYTDEHNTKWRVASVTGPKGTEVIVVDDDLGETRCLDLQGRGPGGAPVLIEEFNVWSAVAVDTPIWVKDRTGDDWLPRHFAKLSSGGWYVLAWTNGTTSHSAPTEAPTTRWELATLVKPT